MNLEIQIQSLISSFVYGLYLSLIYNIFYKYLYNKNIIINLISNLLFTIINVSSYFFILILINKGTIHIYFLISLICGFLVGNNTTKKIRTKTIRKKNKLKALN